MIRAFALAVMLASVSACGAPVAAPSSQPPPVATVSSLPLGSASAPPSAGIVIPVGALPPDVQCMVDHGARIINVNPPVEEGGRPGYELQAPELPPAESSAIFAKCLALGPPDIPKTEAELRVIYDRWVKERECLVGLGYHPVEPPTFETFVAGWNSGSVWMSTDGVDTGAWTSAEYEAAKKACTLANFSRS